MKNRNLNTAKKKKNDEFYTQYEDVKKEIDHYADQLKDKIIFCNCDDSNQSNFYKYFSDNFEILGLKELISSNADFRSEESIDILKECDIVITNPPFSLFREYIAQLMEYDKKFLVIGHQNAITYKEVFKYIKENKLWLGYGFKGGATHFINKHYEDYATAGDHKDGMIRVSGVVWFTNMDTKKRHADLIRDILYKKYTPEEYPKYDNYDAINVDKTKDIPLDYYAVIGVPITYFYKHNPDQFEILGAECFEDIETSTNVFQKPTHKLENSNREVYKRLWIKRKLK